MKIDPTILAILAGAGTLFAFWAQVKNLLTRFVSFFVTFVTVEDSPLAIALKSYCFSNLRKSRFGVRNYSGADALVRPRNAVQFIAFERLGANQVFWKGLRPIWIKNEQSKDRGMLRVSFIRGTFDPDRLLDDSIEHYNGLARNPSLRRYRVTHVFGKGMDPSGRRGAEDQPASRPTTVTSIVHESRLLRWSLDDIGPALSKGSPIDEMVIPDALESAIAEARFWRKSESWYRDRGIPWKRGWLLYGPPGTGKTSLARAIAEELDLPIFAYDLSSLANEELRSAWSQMLRESPCMALIEDVDGVFDGRRNVTGRVNGLSFDVLINCIDGVERSNGVFLVITTNELSKVDRALGVPRPDMEMASSRPGRVDRAIELGRPDAVGLAKVCRRILPDRRELWAETVRQGVSDGETVAQFQERCARLALILHWGRFGGGTTASREVRDARTEPTGAVPDAFEAAEAAPARKVDQLPAMRVGTRG